jgi:hypothetical protein
MTTPVVGGISLEGLGGPLLERKRWSRGALLGSEKLKGTAWRASGAATGLEIALRAWWHGFPSTASTARQIQLQMQLPWGLFSVSRSVTCL